jgi:hypothetical protein
MATDLSHIRETLEIIRLEQHPNIPAQLIDMILEAEADHQEEGQRRLALAKTRSAIDAAVQEA